MSVERRLVEVRRRVPKAADAQCGSGEELEVLRGRDDLGEVGGEADVLADRGREPARAVNAQRRPQLERPETAAELQPVVPEGEGLRRLSGKDADIVVGAGAERARGGRQRRAAAARCSRPGRRATCGRRCTGSPRGAGRRRGGGWPDLPRRAHRTRRPRAARCRRRRRRWPPRPAGRRHRWTSCLRWRRRRSAAAQRHGRMRSPSAAPPGRAGGRGRRPPARAPRRVPSPPWRRRSASRLTRRPALRGDLRPGRSRRVGRRAARSDWRRTRRSPGSRSPPVEAHELAQPPQRLALDGRSRRTRPPRREVLVGRRHQRVRGHRNRRRR